MIPCEATLNKERCHVQHFKKNFGLRISEKW